MCRKGTKLLYDWFIFVNSRRFSFACDAAPSSGPSSLDILFISPWIQYVIEVELEVEKVALQFLVFVFIEQLLQLIFFIGLVFILFYIIVSLRLCSYAISVRRFVPLLKSSLRRFVIDVLLYRKIWPAFLFSSPLCTSISRTQYTYSPRPVRSVAAVSF